MEANSRLDNHRLRLNLSGCAAPCVVDIETKGQRLDENEALLIKFDEQTTNKIGIRSWRVFPNDAGLRIVLLKTGVDMQSDLLFPQEFFLDVKAVRVSEMRWKLI